MAKRYPGSVIDYNVYGEDGLKLLGVSTVELPSMEAMTQEISGAGILGTFDDPIPGMIGSMVATLNFHWIDRSAMYPVGYRVMFDLRAALGAVDMSDLTNLAVAERINIVGKVKTYNPGNRQTGTSPDASMGIEVGRIQQWIGGLELMLFDRMAYIYRVNGVDALTGVRAAIT